MNTHGIDISGGTGFNPGDGDVPAAARPAGRGPVEREQPDLTLRNDYDALIEAVLRTSQPNAAEVQQAVSELAKNTLDTPENIRTAAENILKFGI